MSATNYRMKRREAASTVLAERDWLMELLNDLILAEDMKMGRKAIKLRVARAREAIRLVKIVAQS